MREIELSNGMRTLLDDQDYEKFAGFRWNALRAQQEDERYYAFRRTAVDGTIYLHRAILAAPKGVTVDHENGDGLDNRRDNIRLATRSQNNANRKSASATGYRGVETFFGKFRAYISNPGRIGSKNIRLGVYVTPEEAAAAYDVAAQTRFGEFARLNFPAAR